MKRYFIGILLILVFITGCRLSADTDSQADSSVGMENRKNSAKPKETPGISSSIRFSDREYDTYQVGKEIKDCGDTDIYFSDRDFICYTKMADEKENEEIFFLYDRREKKKHRIMKIKNIDSGWGSMCEKDGRLYYAIGFVKDGKESSSLLVIDEKTFRGELIKIRECNTIFSSVVCTDDAVFAWFIKEQGDINEYCLTKLTDGKFQPVDSWVYKGHKDAEGKEDGVGQVMKPFNTNGKELFCYVEDFDDSDDRDAAHMEIYDSIGNETKSIPIDFMDFEYMSEESDMLDFGNEADESDGFWDIYCFEDIILFRTLNSRILVAKYDGKSIEKITEEELYHLLAGEQNGGESGIESGSYGVMAAFPDKVVLGGLFENTDRMVIWDIAQNSVKSINFHIEDEEMKVLSSQMLTENEVMLTLADDNLDKENVFYCKLD